MDGRRGKKRSPALEGKSVSTAKRQGTEKDVDSFCGGRPDLRFCHIFCQPDGAGEEELHISGEGRFFYEVKPFEEIIKVVKNIKRINISKLEDLPEWFDELLHKYQYLTNYSDRRINRLCILLNRQINKLKTLIEDE